MGGGKLFEDDASKKGFRDTGRGGASKGDVGLLRAGDAARLRKGLLEERLRFRLEEDGRSEEQTGFVSGGFMHICVCDGDSLESRLAGGWPIWAI